MTINEVKYFQAVVRFDSVSKAAENLNVSQPAVSQAIKSLEEEFGLCLFERSGKRLILTEEGQFFLKYASDLLFNIESLEETMKDKGRKKSMIQIGVPALVGTFLFPKFIRGFLKSHPDINLSILELGSLKILPMIETNSLQLGFVSYKERDDNSNYEYVDLLDTEFVFVVNKNNPLAQKDVLEFKDIENENIILYSKGSFQNGYIQEKLDENHVHPNIFMYSSQIATILEFLKEDNLGAFLHKEAVKFCDKLKGISFVDPIKVKVGLVYKKGSENIQSINSFIEYAKNYKFE